MKNLFLETIGYIQSLIRNQIKLEMLLDVINSEIQKFNECGLAEWSGILDEAIAKFDLGNPRS